MGDAAAITRPAPRWDFAVPDWTQRLFSGRSLVPALPLDAAEADRATRIFDKLRVPDVAGMPTNAEAAGDWIRDIIAAVFGSLDESGRRRVADVFVLVPKKNAKTTQGGAIMLTALLINKRPRAEFALFGPTQEVANRAFDAVSGMIKADPELDKLLHVKDHLKIIEHRLSKATLKITTFDMQTATGGKYAGWLLDELHLLGVVHYAARVIAQLRGARVAIPESFGIIITTQSDVPPAGAFKDELTLARKVRDGEIVGGSLLPVLYEFPESMQIDPGRPWADPANWALVNPNVGRSVSVQAIVELRDTAMQTGEEAFRVFASQHLNIQIGGALHADRWLGTDHWSAASLPRMSLGEMLARCEVATIGADGGGLDDLFGLCVLGRERESKRWLAWFRAWADRGVLELRKSIAPELLRFVEDGDLVLVDLDAGASDIVEVADIVEQVWTAGLLPAAHGVGLDSAGVAALTDEIAARGVPPDCMAAVSQGWRLNGVQKGTARKLKDKSLRPLAQPIAAWCAANAKTEPKGNAVMITKARSGTAKIDPLMALFNAVDLMSRNPEASGGPSAYETEELTII